MEAAEKLWATDADVALLVSRFEGCELKLHEFTHRAHLTVAVAYLVEFGESGAIERMRKSLRRFSSQQGKTGYHETITRFWIRLLRTYVAGQPSLPLHELGLGAVRKFEDKELIFGYYSRERLMSHDARLNWVEPDLKPLPSGDVEAPKGVAEHFTRDG